MGKIALFLLPFVKGALLKLLRKNKEKVIKQINDKIDIPGLDEKDESKVFMSIYNFIEMLIIKNL